MDKPSKKEAEIIIEKSRDKAFWSCDEMNNYVKLQGAIDVLYNCIPGNKYTVNYKKNQSTTRLEVHCQTCDLDLSSYDPFISHEGGKNHKRVRQQNQPQGSNSNSSAMPKRRKINSPWDFLETADGTLEKKLNGTSRTVLGAHMVYKEKINGEYHYTCTLCQEDGAYRKILKDEMYEHITNKHHLKKYLHVKFEIDTKENLIEEAKNIEEIEGKIHHFLSDFTEVESDDERYTSPSAQRSRSPDRKRSCNGGYPESPTSPNKRLNPSKPILVNKGTSVNSNECDILDVARPILEELASFSHGATKDQVAEMVSQDTDLQGHIINSLWSLNMRLDKYYEQTNKKFPIPGQPSLKLKTCTQKIKEYIKKLQLIEPERSPEQ